MAATPFKTSVSHAKPLFTGVPAAVQYVAELLDQAPSIIATAVNKALDEEVDYVRSRAEFTEHATMTHQFDIRTEMDDDGATFVYGFTAPHGLRDPRTGRFMSWKTMEYGEEGTPATGFLRSAAYNRQAKLGRRITQLITEELG